MKVLLDEGVPYPLARSLIGHDVQTVDDIRCNGVKNGKLLQIVEELRFEIFITADKNIPNQQELSRRPFAILLLSTNNWPTLRTRTDAILSAVDIATPGTVVRVDCADPSNGQSAALNPTTHPMLPSKKRAHLPPNLRAPASF